MINKEYLDLLYEERTSSILVLNKLKEIKNFSEACGQKLQEQDILNKNKELKVIDFLIEKYLLLHIKGI